ncbi:PAS domain S-box protein [Nostoc sp. CENA67]|uniref:histidine kinase n=1 Tax=Amazonocrinis nigriterrae CENA67 TaxID=2794033 RepID=A0A8J7LAQ2_9NOST|nr:PAS domain S-box protein [Amazonocrinis nigriterrae]MBH8562911.1 PAS domain S-box protein [Amazonocrinis nigriterrae CENA67]
MRFNDQLIDLPDLYDVIDYSPLTICPNSYVVDAVILMSQQRTDTLSMASFSSSLVSSRWNQQQTSYILVVEAGHLLGILTNTDIVRITASGRDLSQIKIADVMTQPVVSLVQSSSQSQDIFTALSLLRQSQISHLPIVDEREQLIGIVNETNLLQAFDLLKMVGVVTALEQHLQQPKDDCGRVNQDIEAVRWQTYNYLKRWVDAQSAEVIQVNRELQQALEELQAVEEELRQQNEELAFAHEIAELERQRYQDLFEFAPNGYLVTDVHGVIQEANYAAATLLSVHQNYLVGKSLVVFVAESDRHKFTTQLKSLQNVQNWEIDFKPLDGTPFPASIRIATVYNSQRQRIGWRWLLCDISDRKQTQEALRRATDELEQRVVERTTELLVTNQRLQQEIIERKRTEEALRQSEKLYRQLVESQTDLIIRIDMQQRITFANTAACQTLGYPLDELCGQEMCQFLHLDEMPQAREQLTTLALPPHNFTISEQRILTVNGTRWVQWNVAGIKDESGNIVEIQGVARDITDRKQMEAALRTSEEKFRHFAENINAAIWIISPDPYQTSYVSPAYEKIWGRYCESLSNQPESWIDSIHPQDRDRIRAIIAQQHLSGESTSLEYRILRPDGSIRWIWDRSFAIRDEQGKIYSFGGIAEDITERKRSEDSLRESEEKFRHFADNTHAVLWMASLESGDNLYVNPAYEKIWGRTCQSLRDQPNSWLDAVHPEDRDRIMEKLEQQRQGQATDTEYRILRPDGSIRWIWDRGFVMQDEQGEIYSYGGVAEDITERKQAEDSLRQSEERLSLALEAGNIGVWDWNLLTNESVWSANIRPMLGFSSGPPLAYEEFLNLIHPEDLESMLECVADTIKQGTRPPFNYRVIWPDGSIHWLSVKGQVYYNELSEPIRMIGTTRDITDRKQAEQKIKEQAALLDITTDAILLRNLQSQILFWNKGAERLYGWQVEEVMGKDALEILYKETCPQLETALKTVTESGLWQGELNKVTKSGKEIIVESRWSLMRDAAGEPQSILIVDTDITQKKQLEEQFFRGQRLESLGTLAGGIAHDLNNILTPILAASQLIQVKFANDQERCQHLLTIVENNAKRGAALVKQVLSFARGFKGERTIVQIKHLISEITQIAKQTFPKSIEFAIALPEDLWTISGDITQLHQVLMNLVVNARDAMPDGGTIKISTENMFIDEAYARMNLDAKVGHYVVITVADTGIGMPPEILDRIFEPFFTTKEIGTGTGLGLSTMLGIIKSHDGFVSVSSQVGKGSQFKLFLPAVQATQAMNAEETEPPRGNGELILVVDDEVQIREITTIILEDYNYKALTASNGIEAIALYAQYKHEISVVLMDMMMPEMDGMTAIRTLQKMNPQVQIIACSGFNPNEKFIGTDGTNIECMLLKPFTAQELLHSLHHLLKSSQIN